MGSRLSAGVAAECQQAPPLVFRGLRATIPAVPRNRRAAGRSGDAARRLRRRAGTLVLLAAFAFAAETPAVTVGPGGLRTWSHPGTNPCRDLCHPDWALARMRPLMPPDVHDELVRRLGASIPVGRYYVSTGDRILAMSYAKRGVPFLELVERIAQFQPEVRYEARGYAVAHDGLLYRFVRIAAGGNWALIVAPLVVQPAVVWSNAPVRLAVPGLGGVLFGGRAITGSGGAVLLAQPPRGYPLLHTLPTSMPPPSALWLLGSALAALGALRLLRGQKPIRDRMIEATICYFTAGAVDRPRHP